MCASSSPRYRPVRLVNSSLTVGPLAAVDAQSFAGGADPDQVAAGAAALGPPDAAVPGEALVAQVVEAEAVDPDLDRGRPRQVQVDEAGRELQVDRDLGRRVAEADGQAGDARLDGDAAQVELGQVQVGGDRARGDVDPPGQGGVELDPPVVAAVAGQHPPLGGGPQVDHGQVVGGGHLGAGLAGAAQLGRVQARRLRVDPQLAAAQVGPQLGPGRPGGDGLAGGGDHRRVGGGQRQRQGADHGHHQQEGADGAQRAPAGAAADPLQADAGEGQGDGQQDGLGDRGDPGGQGGHGDGQPGGQHDQAGPVGAGPGPRR